MSDPAFALRNLIKRHSKAFALEIPALEVPRGEILGLIGPTGAGKTTLLRLLSGLEVPTSGELRMFDAIHSPGVWPPEALRRIASVPQRPLLLADSVRYNVEVGLRARGLGPSGRRVQNMLEGLNIANLARQHARTLSGGQTQLVALARALVLEPEVLLLDEPTANLDPAHVAVVEQVLRDQQQQTGATIVWATHNLYQARRNATRAVLLLGGGLVEIARTEQLFEQPGDPRTADFIAGRMVY